MQTMQLFFNHYKNVTEIANVLSKEFVNLCYWFVDNKLSIHFCEDKKTKHILFSREKSLQELKLTYDNNRIKQYHIVEYLGSCLDANLSGWQCNVLAESTQNCSFYMGNMITLLQNNVVSCVTP